MRNFCLSFCVIFILGFCDLRAEVKDDQGLNDFVTHYYLNPQPHLVGQALAYFFQSNSFKGNTNPHAAFLTAYFFGRVANLNSELLREYEQFYDSEGKPGKLFLLTIFSIASDEQNRVWIQQKFSSETDAEIQKGLKTVMDSSPINNTLVLVPVRKVQQLDFLWIEFFVTGSEEPLIRIMDVLNWEDRLRSKLMKWMSEAHNADDKEKLSNILNHEIGITADLNQNKINNEGDLDCVFAFYLNTSKNTNKSEVATHLRNILDLSDADILYMATKASAEWSLWANARKHKRILEVCEREFKRRTDKSRIELGELILSIERNPVSK